MSSMVIPELAADLSDLPKLRERVDAEKHATELRVAARAELVRIDARINRLDRKAARLPIGNHKRKTLKQAGRLRQQRQQLQEAIR